MLAGFAPANEGRARFEVDGEGHGKVPVVVGDGGNGDAVNEPCDFFGGVLAGIDVKSIAGIKGGFVVIFANFGPLFGAPPDLDAVLYFAGVQVAVDIVRFIVFSGLSVPEALQEFYDIDFGIGDVWILRIAGAVAVEPECGGEAGKNIGGFDACFNIAVGDLLSGL